MHAYVHTYMHANRQTDVLFFLFYIYLVRSRSYMNGQDNILFISCLYQIVRNKTEIKWPYSGFVYKYQIAMNWLIYTEGL